MRACFFQYPDDIVTWTLDQQYFLGEDLLVAPVFDRQTVEFYVPAGKWVNILNGKTVEGPSFVKEQHGMMPLPLLSRPNAGIIISREGHNIVDRITDPAKGFTLLLSKHIDTAFEVRPRTRKGSTII